MVQSTTPITDIPLIQHPLRLMLSNALRQNTVLDCLNDEELGELESLLVIAEVKKEDLLLAQGSVEMEQYFILEGLLKRVVANPEGKEMILRFAGAKDIETSYAAWRLETPAPYSIRAVTKVRVAKCPMPQWAELMSRHPQFKRDGEYEVMRLMSEMMAHSITIHLLDAAGRMKRFQRKHPELATLIPKKDLALHLNISPETLSRLLHQE
jgi:CRP-like cAMP-binding protein